MNDMQRLRRAADMQEIRDCLMSYCRGIDRGDGAALRRAYHPDAHEDHGPFSGNPADLIPFLFDVLKNVETCVHTILNVLIELDGDVAMSEAYFLAIQRERGDTVEDYIMGRYLDRFERRDGEWRIAKRTVVLDWSRRAPFNGPSPYAPLAAFPTGRRGDADLLYRIRGSVIPGLTFRAD